MKLCLTRFKSIILIFVATIAPFFLINDYRLLRNRISLFGSNDDHSLLPIINDTIVAYANVSIDTEQDFLILAIGFHKMGTTSLYQFFKANDINSMHSNQEIRPLMKKRMQNKEAPLLDLTQNANKNYTFFSDFGASYVLPHNRSYRYLFETMLYYYPNAKFILNIRDRNRWLRSLWLHLMDHMVDPKDILAGKINTWFLPVSANIEGNYATFKRQSRIYKHYLCYVLRYFSSHTNITHNLILYDIEIDSANKLVEYFSNYGITLNASLYGNGNARNNKIYLNTSFYKEQENKYNKLIQKHPRFAINISAKQTTYEYLEQRCNVSIIGVF